MSQGRRIESWCVFRPTGRQVRSHASYKGLSLELECWKRGKKEVVVRQGEMNSKVAGSWGGSRIGFGSIRQLVFAESACRKLRDKVVLLLFRRR